MLQIVDNTDLDRDRWNKLVNDSKQGKAYSYDWYLSAHCTWDAIVLDDYRGAMALPYVISYGMRRLIQPAFVQQCPWMGVALNTDELEQLWDVLTAHFAIIHFNTNLPLPYNTYRTNLVLDLIDREKQLENYSRSLRKNIRRIDPELYIEPANDPSMVIELYKRAYGELNPALRDEHYDKLVHLHREHPDSFKALHMMYHGEVVAGLLFLRDDRRFYYILGAPNAQGRTLNAISHGIDHIILNHQGMMLDFEGSGIPLVKAFYMSFGAKDEGFNEIFHIPNPLLRQIYLIYKKMSRS